MLLETGQSQRAYDASLRILAMWPDDYFTHVTASHALSHLKRFAEAKRFIIEGPKVWMNDSTAWHQLACIKAAVRNFTSARKCVLTATSLEPDYRWVLRVIDNAFFILKRIEVSLRGRVKAKPSDRPKPVDLLFKLVTQVFTLRNSPESPRRLADVFLLLFLLRPFGLCK